jgi:DNA-binding LytR/AlgR family response regulator
MDETELEIGLLSKKDVQQADLENQLAHSIFNLNIHRFDSYENVSSFLEHSRLDFIFIEDVMVSVKEIKYLNFASSRLKVVIFGSSDLFSFDFFRFSFIYFLRCPINQEELRKAVRKGMFEEENGKEGLFSFSFNREQIFISLKNVSYFASEGRYVNIYLTDGSSYRYIAKLDDLSLPYFFYRCHKSFSVNLRHVVKISKNTAYLKGGKDVPISRGMFEGMKESLLSLLAEA